MEQTGDRMCLAGRRWAQDFELIKRSQKAVFFTSFRNIMQAKENALSSGSEPLKPSFQLLVRELLRWWGFLSASSERVRDLPLSSGFGEVWSECGLKIRWENGGVLDSLKHLGECRSEFYEDLMTIHAKEPSTQNSITSG